MVINFKMEDAIYLNFKLLTMELVTTWLIEVIIKIEISLCKIDGFGAHWALASWDPHQFGIVNYFF